MDTLHHDREHLPERAALGDAAGQIAEILEQASAFRTSLSELGTSEASAQAEAESTMSRIKELENQMRGGNVYAVRDLQAIAHQVATLQDKATHLDELQIGLMEERERLDAEVRGLAAKHRDAINAQNAATRVIAAAEHEIDGRVAKLQNERDVVAQTVTQALLSDYEHLRKRLGGVGAALLVGHRCGGCQLELSNGEIDALRRQPEGSAGHCEQCGRLIVILD